MILSAIKKTSLLILLFFFAACSANPGIEAGNPNIAGKKITVVPENSSNTFVIEFLEGFLAEVTRIQSLNFEKTLIPYTYSDGQFHLSAAFLDGTQIGIALALDANQELVLLEFIIDGQPVSASPEPPGASMQCEETSPDSIQNVADTLCTRIVNCNTTYVCADCVSQVLVVPGLSKQFGGNPNSSLQESAQEVQNGNTTLNVTALQTCLEDISILPCSLIREIFNDSLPPNYNEVKGLVPKPACSNGVLKEK